MPSMVAAIEQCHRKAARLKHPRENWYQRYSLENGYEFQDPIQVPKYHMGDEIPSIEAVNPDLQNDVRPRFFDNVTRTWTLLDSGSCVSCVPKGPQDKLDPRVKLRAVNGQSIPTYGTEVITVRIGRKEYSIEAIKTDFPQRILGWDLFRKYKLGFAWNDSDDLYLTDDKAQIKSLLKFIKIDAAQRIEAVDSYQEPPFERYSNQRALFELKCMRELDEVTFAEATFSGQVDAMTIQPEHPSPIADNVPLSSKVDPEANAGYLENLKALDKLEEPFKSLVEQYKILRADFKKEPSTDIYHRIETSGEPFKSKVRPLLASSEKSKLGKEIWEEMEKLGVIERVKQNTTLQYTSPVHLVKKPNGNGWRVCADFRLLNSRTKSDNYPLPLLRSFQTQIKGSKVFSKIDLTSAFHHLPIHPDDVNKTCVLSPWGGAFVYKRLAFGLTNGPSSWQKYIDSVLSGIEGQFCYLDDILVATENMESHMSVLSQIFERLQQHELTLSLSKCQFGQSSVEYLGYRVSATGICPLERKVEAIQQIPAPKTQKNLLQFLGALNYFRSSLSGIKRDGKYHNAANLLQPLYSAATVPIPGSKFGEVWKSSPVLQQAFKDAKELLKKAAELAHPDPSLPLALMTDASQHSIGSVLMQQSKQGKWHPLGYMSRHLPFDKVQWSTCRKELLAAQAGLRYFISEIYGRHCTIWSDHAPLVLAFKNPQGFQLHDPVAQRALMEIGQFTKDVRHVSGLANVGSDFLSRIPPSAKGSAYEESSTLTNEVATIEGKKLVCISPAVIHEAQQSCKEMELIKAGRHPTSVIFQSVKFGAVELLCEVSQDQPRPFLPKVLRNFVIKQMHYAHKGVRENIRQISTHYYWSDMKAEITRFVQTCHGCQSTKPSHTRSPHYGNFSVPDRRFTHCHVDIVGPLPESEGYKYLLTIIDRTTRQLSALPLREPSAKSCSQAFLLHYVALYGLPSACTSDQGSNFVSSLFQEMQKGLGIEINHTPIYWPQGNGLIERNHQTLKTSIKAQLVEMGQKYQNNWFQVLPWALLGMRTAFNKDLGTSSNELTLGTHVQVPGCILQEVSHDSAEPNIKDILENLQIKDSRTGVPTSKNQQTPVDPPSDKITHVYVRQHDTKGLEQMYRGPFKVLERPTRSSLEIKTGLTKEGVVRKELRAWSDCKPAKMRDGVVEAERPKRGRPPKESSDPQPVEQPPEVEPPPVRPVRSTRNPMPNYVDAISAIPDFSQPPPSFCSTAAETPKAWVASKEDLSVINQSITGS